MSGRARAAIELGRSARPRRSVPMPHSDPQRLRGHTRCTGSVHAPCRQFFLSGCAAPYKSSARLTSATVEAGESSDQAHATYRRALTLDNAGRCDDARVYEDYARLVRQTNPAMALTYSKQCWTPLVTDPRGTAPSPQFSTAMTRAPLPSSSNPDLSRRGTSTCVLSLSPGCAEPTRLLWPINTPRTALRTSRTCGPNRSQSTAAHVLQDAQRYGEAANAYDAYSALVRPWSEHDAEMASVYKSSCGR